MSEGCVHHRVVDEEAELTSVTTHTESLSNRCHLNVLKNPENLTNFLI